MDVRENLVELLDKIFQPGQKTLGDIADYLISNGVTVQECKLGDKIYQTDGVRIYESIVGEITLTAKHTIFVTENIVFDERAIGNSVFLSYAEAEAHLPKPPKGEEVENNLSSTKESQTYRVERVHKMD